MKKNTSIKPAHFFCHPLLYPLGELLLVAPITLLLLSLCVWKNVDLVWGAPLCWGTGWFLILASTYRVIVPSKKRIALDILYGGLVAGATFCCLSFFIKGLDYPLRDQTLKTPGFVPTKVIKEIKLPPSGEPKTEGDA